MQKRLVYSAMLLSSLLAGQVLANGNAVNKESGEVFIRDPFTPSRLMYEQAGTRANIDSEVFGFRPSDNPDIQIPKMRLRGFVTPEGEQEMLALLEISGSGVFMVREGDEINIDPNTQKNQEADIKLTVGNLGIDFLNRRMVFFGKMISDHRHNHLRNSPPWHFYHDSHTKCDRVNSIRFKANKRTDHDGIDL